MKTSKFLFVSILLSLQLMSCSNANNQDFIEDKENNDEEIQQNCDFNLDNVDISKINIRHKLIAFTYDDGPYIENQEDLLNVFNDFNSKNPEYAGNATFFYVGNKIKEDTYESINRVYNAGFEIGNHSYNHGNYQEMTKEEIQEDINKTFDAIKKAIPTYESGLVRTPGGHTEGIISESIDYPMINWTTNNFDLDTLDWKEETTKDDVYQKVISNLIDGGIVLMHQTSKTCVQATKALLPVLKAKGYQVCSVSQLAKARNITLKAHEVYWGLTDLL